MTWMCSRLLPKVRHHPVQWRSLHIHPSTLLLWWLESEQPVSAACFFTYCPWYHWTHLPQIHNDSDCGVPMRPTGKMHDKGILFCQRKWTLLAHRVNVAHLQKLNNVLYCPLCCAAERDWLNKIINHCDGLMHWLQKEWVKSNTV